MNKLTRRQRQAIDTKLRITKKAADLFTTKGFNDVTVRDICEASSISIGTFYHHFRSKDEIVNTGHYQIDILLQERTADFRKQGTKEDILFLFEQAGELLQNVGWKMASQIYSHLITSKIKYTFRKDRPIIVQMRKIIEEGLNKDIFLQNTNTEEFIEMIMRFSRGIIFDWCLREGKYNLVDQLRKDLSLILANYCR